MELISGSSLHSVSKRRLRLKANKPLMVVAAVLVGIPIVALLWVDSYAKAEPTLAGFPFFIWYQFLWVFLCAACTRGAYSIVLIARPRHRKQAER
jgi:hypothetical protein